MKSSHLLPLLLLLVIGLQAPAAHYKLFVLTGQSNSLGTTNGGEADPSSGSDPADNPILFWWDNIAGEGVDIGDSGGAFLALQDQQGGFYAGSASHWGGEMEFGRTLYRAGVRDFGIIKASRGGGGNTFWLKGSSDDHMYRHVVDTVTAATTALTNDGHTFEILGLLYLQGESDSGVEITEAGTRLKTLTDNLRADLPNAANLHTVAAGTTAKGLTSSDNQEAIATSTSYIDFFANTDLSLAPDNVHLDKAAKLTLGNRWALAFLNAGIVDRHYGKLVFIGDSITQGGNGRPSYRYPVFKNLANAGVPQDAATGYAFVGSVTGAYQNNAGATPDVNGQTFNNVHDGHWGWRAFWINGRTPFPGGRYNVNNLGQGTLENWTGQTNTFTTGDLGTLTYTGSTYTPDTVVMKIGINDLGDGTSATQVRDDISTLIDQLRAANPNVRIHLSQILYTSPANKVSFETVDAVNALLPQLVSDKNAVSATSPVWLITANEGFEPVSMTYDSVHPNTLGEEYVGNRMSGGLGIIEMPIPPVTTPISPEPLEEKASDGLGVLHFEGSDIYNTGSLASGWSSFDNKELTLTSVGTSDLRVATPSTDHRTLNGTDAGWSDLNDGVWTFEARLKFNAVDNGFMIWLGTGTHRILVEIHPDRIQDYQADSFNVTHPVGEENDNGVFHTITIIHDPAAAVYHVFRDGIRITPEAGAPYDQIGADERLMLGDYTGEIFGDGYDVTIDYVSFQRGYTGDQIHDGTGLMNGWTPTGGISTSLDGANLQVVNTTAGGSWLEGTNTEWASIREGYWTFEIRLTFNANPNGFILWLGTGTDIIYVEIYGDRTQDTGGQTFNVSHNNLDGNVHTFRIGHDPVEGVYHVWRDGVRLTPNGGAAYDSTTDDVRLILGDFTSGTFGNAFDVTIESIRMDGRNAFVPPGADADGDGMSDVYENTWFDNITGGDPAANSDDDALTNLQEYLADTNPLNADSFPVIANASLNNSAFQITIPATSSRRQYTLESTGNLTAENAWNAVDGQGPVAGNGGNLVFTDTPSHSAAFYRVNIELL